MYMYVYIVVISTSVHMYIHIPYTCTCIHTCTCAYVPKGGSPVGVLHHLHHEEVEGAVELGHLLQVGQPLLHQIAHHGPLHLHQAVLGGTARQLLVPKHLQGRHAVACRGMK